MTKAIKIQFNKIEDAISLSNLFDSHAEEYGIIDEIKGVHMPSDGILGYMVKRRKNVDGILEAVSGCDHEFSNIDKKSSLLIAHKNDRDLWESINDWSSLYWEIEHPDVEKIWILSAYHAHVKGAPKYLIYNLIKGPITYKYKKTNLRYSSYDTNENDWLQKLIESYISLGSGLEVDQLTSEEKDTLSSMRYPDNVDWIISGYLQCGK